jgi:Glycosyl hydrolase family 26
VTIVPIQKYFSYALSDTMPPYERQAQAREKFMLKRGFALSVLILGSVTLLPATSQAACTPGVSGKLVPNCGAWLGAASNHHPDDSPKNWEGRMQKHEDRIGRALDIVHNYHGPKDPVPMPMDANSQEGQEEIARANAGHIVYMSWKPSDDWRAVGQGDPSADALLDQGARNIIAVAPRKVMLTIWHEPEMGQNGTTRTPQTYVKMWRHIHQRFAQQGVTNVVWVYNPTGYLPNWESVELAFYPGDFYVDWIMWDPYSPNGNRDYITTISGFYDWLWNHDGETNGKKHHFRKKPWGLGEWGVSGGDSKWQQRYYADARASFTRFPKLKAYVIWDSFGKKDFRIDFCCVPTGGELDPEEQAAYNVFAHDPWVNQPRIVP